MVHIDCIVSVPNEKDLKSAILSINNNNFISLPLLADGDHNEHPEENLSIDVQDLTPCHLVTGRSAFVRSSHLLWTNMAISY